MSDLVLNISADTSKLAMMEDALDRLERLLKNPTSVNLATLTTQVNKLEAESVSTAAAIAKLEKGLTSVVPASKGAAAAEQELNKALAGTSAVANEAEAELKLLTASYSVFAKSAVDAGGAMLITTNDLKAQGEATTELLFKMEALIPEVRKHLAAEQARLAVIKAADKEFALHTELLGLLAVEESKLIPILRQETLETAKLALSKGLITKARYDELAGISATTSAAEAATAAAAQEFAAINLLTASHSEFVAATKLAAAAGVDFQAALQTQAAASAELLAVMSALPPEIRAMQVAEQGAAGVKGVANREIALQIELTTLMNAASSTYITTLKAETLELAKQALAKGVITQKRYEDIAGIKKETAALHSEAAAIRGVGAASVQASAAGTTLNGVMRGAAGATGTLWMSYGSVLPLLAAFAAVSGTLKSYKEALNFEYAVGYMASLGKATGDTTASIGELKAGLLSIKDVSHGPVELADSLKALMKAGFSAADSMKELKTLSRLATVAEEDLATTTGAVISQFRAWSVSSVGAARGVKTMSEAANILAAAALTTTLDVGELSKMMKYTPVLASQSKVSFVELAAALGTMANMGVRGTTAATSLRTAIIQLQTPTSKTRRLLDDMHLSIALYDKDGKLKNMSGMFDALAKSLRGLGDKDRTPILKSLFSIRAASGGAVMLQQFNKAIDDGTFSFQKQVEVLKKEQKELSFINDIYGDLEKTTATLWEETKASWSRAVVSALDTESVKTFVQVLKDFAEDGSLTTIAVNIGAIGDAMGIVVRAADAVMPDVIGSYNAMDSALTNLRVHFFGATEGFLAFQHAGELYAKQQQGVIKYTQQEQDVITRLIDVYGSLEVAALAEPFDKKIWSATSKLSELESKQKELRQGAEYAPTEAMRKTYQDQLDLMVKLREELRKLKAEKQEMLADPKAWKAHQDAITAAKAETKSRATEAAKQISIAQDRRDLDLSVDLLRRKDILDQNKFELKVLEESKKSKLISLEDYRLKKKRINDRIRQEAIDSLSEQLALAKDKLQEAQDSAASPTAPAGADKAAQRAELEVERLRQQLWAKRREGVREDTLFNAESNRIKLQKDHEYIATTLELTKKKIESEKKFNLESLSDQQQILDASREAGIISEERHLKKSRELKVKALQVEARALRDQQKILEQERENALKIPGVSETDTEVRKLSSAIDSVKASLAQVEKKQSVLGGLVTTEDLGRARQFNLELETLQRAAAKITSDTNFDISIQSLGGKDQELSSARRDNQQELEKRVQTLIREKGLSAETLSEVTKLQAAYVLLDDAVVASYEKQKEAAQDYYGGAQKALRDYVEETDDLFGQSLDLVANAFSSMEEALVSFVATGKLDFRDLANSIIADLARIAIQQSITKPLAEGLLGALGKGILGGLSSGGGVYGTSASGGFSLTGSSSGFSGFSLMEAKGDAFGSGDVIPFATGAVVDKPTAFPLSRGRTGLMGEAGPEAIMPLTRIGGSLGVSAVGTGETNVVVNNYGDAKEVEVTQSRNASGGTDIIVTLERELSDRIKTRGSRLSRTLESTYGFRRVGGR